MNLVKWFRKNRTKVMAVVVIVILIGFIGGSALTYLLSPERTAGYKAAAYFGDKKKITSYDLAWAREELRILGILRVEDLLRSWDLHGILLGELLFSDTRAAPAAISYMKQAIRENRYRISDEQLSSIYKRSMPSDVYWLLLKKEAELAGIRISNDDVGKLLGRVIPQLFNGTTYSQLVSTLVNRQGIPEERILATVGKLLAVLQYAQMICSSEDVTGSQLTHLVSSEGETIDVAFVPFGSAAFAQTQEQPAEQQLADHFNKYKKFFAGDVTEENPYGFGYKLPDRVQLEYITVKLDDISSIVTPVMPQEMEEYYQGHLDLFTEPIPSDPNDPNSPRIDHTKSYVEVAGTISKRLMQDRVRSKGESILSEARTLTEVGLQDVDTDLESLSSEQLKARAGDYKTTAEQLSKKYKVKLYPGQTGLLSSVDMLMDPYLGRLFVKGYRYPVLLSQVAFSVGKLEAGTPEFLDVQKPRLYENIGPVRDLSAQIMAVVRVIKAEGASEPESVDQTLSKKALEFEPQKEPAAQEGQEQDTKVYSIKERVIEDLKKLAAMDVAKRKAEEFVNSVAENGWDDALAKFNALYSRELKGQGNQQAEPNESDPNRFELESLTNLRRIPSQTLEALAVQSVGNPEERLFVPEAQKLLTLNEAEIESQFIERLYSLVPADSNTVEKLPLSLEFKPHMSFYVIKNISVKRLEQQEYDMIKARRAYQEDHIQSQSLAAVQFNPENIVKRMKFRPVKEAQESADTNAPPESEEAAQ